MTMKQAIAAVLALGGAFALTACGGNGVSGNDVGTNGTVAGTVLTDVNDHTLYVFTSGDCDAACQKVWPPAIVDDAVTQDEEVVASVAITDGQLTVNGQPVYTYVKDQRVGDANGQGVDGAWYVLDRAGNLVRDLPPVNPDGYGY